MRLGYDHEAFWDQTPRTLSLTMQVYNDKQVDNYNERAWLAWHVAGLQRVKKLPRLQTLIIKKDQQQVIDTQIEGLKRWVIATGGKVVYKDG